MTGTCRRCDRRLTNDRAACRTCQHELEKALGDCAWLDDELDIAITGQRSAPIESGPRGTTSGLPWNDRASAARRSLHQLLNKWVQFCTTHGVPGAPTREPRYRITSQAAWLLHCTHGLAQRDEGLEAIDEITDAVARARDLVFWKRAGRLYLGPCERPVLNEHAQVLVERCPGEVYAEEDAATGACDLCEQEVEVTEQQTRLNDRLDAHLMTPAEIARAAVFLGLQAPRETVRKRVNYWHRHHLIEQRAESPAGDPMFRYGDVRDRLLADFKKRDAS
jgi:hypothetical protein